jgi:capsular exopolysaccharide synthesis family protein
MASLAADLIWKDELVENGSVESVSLSDYVGVVWRRKWIVIIVTLLVGGAAAIYAKHQQTLYSSTATVVYNPQAQTATATGQAAKSGTVGVWGASNLDNANTNKFYQDALNRLHPTGALARSASDLEGQTSVSATTSGNGVQFKVSDPSRQDAQVLAGALAQEFPVFIQTPDPALTASQNQLVNLKLEQKDPQKYGPFVKPLVNDPTTGGPKINTTALASVPAQIEVVQTRIATLEQQAADPTHAQVVTSTSVNPASTAVQTQPAVTKTVIIGLFAGFILGVILAFLQDVLDTRIRDVAGVGRRLRLPLLTQIPSPPKNLTGLVSMAEPGPALMHSAEAYRIGKLNLAAAIDRAGARSVMFTSGNNGEGASQTVANLAVVMARSGKHVILVDANMRHSEQGDFFGLDDRAGLSDVLSGNAKLADALTAVDVSRAGGAMISEDGTQRGGLEVLPAGSRAGDPAELLDSAAARDLIVALEERADLVLVDAPALLPVTDAMVLSSKVDAVVVVARAHRASRPTIVALRRALDACPARAIGFVFTGASLGRRFDYGGSFAAGTSGKTSDEFDPREIGVL